MRDQPWVGSLRHVISSDSHRLSAPHEFERLADSFFGEPAASVHGWERAIDAQARIARALGDLLDGDSPQDTAVVRRGAVGTLWYCALADLPISRHEDQRYQGHHFGVDMGSRVPLHRWRPSDSSNAVNASE